MSKNQKDTHLKYGQGILIEGYNKDSKGLMTTKGFADTRARFETYDDILYFKNYRNAIFQVLPASSFDINDQLRFLIENNIQNKGNNLEILKAKAKSQLDQFELTMKSKEKSLVCFGDQVVLKHIDSGAYLSGTIRPSDGKNGAFSVQVTKDLKTSIIFRLMPYRSFENQSNPIPLQSPILIQNVFNKGFLTFQRFGLIQKKQKNIFWEKQPIKSDETYKIPVKTDSTNSQIYECVTHFVDLSLKEVDEQMPWKFSLHFNDVQNDSLIQHDLVYFQHTLNNGVLATFGDEEIVLKQSKGEKTSELCFYDCLWEIEEYKDRSNDSYILRHLMSGMTLGVQYIKTAQGLQPLRPKLVDISDGKGGGDNQNDRLGVIQLKLAKKSGGQINSLSYINICCGELCLDIAKDKQKETTKRDVQAKMLYESQNIKAQDRKQIIDINTMMVMASNQFDYEIKKLDFTLDISKHCFVIQEIDSQLKSQVLFALSFHSRLINLREDLKWGAEESEKKVTYLRMMQITQKTKQIKYFLKDTTVDDPNREFKRPVLKRQIICLHLGISELLFQLLYFMRKNRDGQLSSKDGNPIKGPKIFATKANQFQKFVQMYNAIYQVIFELIRDNMQFKIHISKWIIFIFEDVIQNNQEYQLKTLLQLLKNNSFFVNNFVTEELISYLVNYMLFDKNATYEFNQIKYIQIFRAFCICGDQVNSENQTLILNKFLKKLTEEVGSKYEIKLQKKKNEEGIEQIGCKAAFDKNNAKWRKFFDYYKMCKDEYPTAWQYLIAYFHLIADMCRGRNKVVQSYISMTMTLDVISQLMIKEKLYDAQVSIIRIMHYLFAENQYFYPIDTVTRVFNYNNIQQQIALNSTTSDVRPKSLIGPVMVSLIEKLKTYGPIELEQVAKNQCLYSILSFLKQTFILGFWQQQKQIKQIYKCICTLIEPESKIDYKLIKQQSQKPQIMLMIGCKQKCLQILEYIIDLDIDYYLKHLNKTFRNYQIPVRKIQLQVTDFLQASEDTNISVQFFDKFKTQNKDLQSIVSTQICPLIIELSRHRNPSLTGSSLRILQRILDFYRHVAKGFIDMIFVCEKNRIDLHKFICERRDKFFTLEYQTTTKINMANQKSLYFLMYKDEKDAGIMQDLYMISQLVKNENSLQRMRDIKTLDSSGTFKQLAEDKLINFTSERRSSNIMKQKVVAASQIHQKVLKYVFNCKQIPVDNLALKLLHLCYRFLVSIIQNNQQLKLTLIPHIPKMMPHLQKNIGCIDFFKQMYDNNRNMLYNESEILKLIKSICSIIEQQDTAQSFYKSKLLDFFRYLIYCNGHAFQYNQIQILKIMQDDSFKNIIIEVTSERIRRLVDGYVEGNKGETVEGTIRCVKMNAELTYMVSFFQIMVSLIDDGCKVNAGKLVKKFPFDRLVHFIQLADRCWPLKRNIRAFLNRLYYFESEIQIYFSTIKVKQIENIIRDLNYFIELKCKTTSTEFEGQYFQNPVRFSYLQSYLYLNLQQCLFTLFQLVKNPKLVNEFKNFLHSAKNSSKTGPYNIIRICERLGWIRNYFVSCGNIFTTSFIKYLLSELKGTIEQFDDNIYAEGMMFGGDRVPTKQEKDKSRQQLIKKILQGQISTFFVQGAPQINGQKPLVYQTPPKFLAPKEEKRPNKQKLARKLRQILTRTKRQFENKDDQIGHKQSKMISAIKLSKQMQKQFSNVYNDRLREIIYYTLKIQEQKKRVLQLQQKRKKLPANPVNPEAPIQEQKVQRMGEPVPPEAPEEANKAAQKQPAQQKKDNVSQIKTLLEYVSSIIQINSTNPQVFSPEIKIFFLNMIIGIIQNSNKTKMEEKKPIDEWEGEDWFQSTKEIEQIQNKLKNGQLGTLIAEILKENISENISLANTILLCGIAYMLGGNRATQKNLIEQIQKDPDNRVFRNLMSLIVKLGKIILKNIDESNLKPVQSEQFQVEIIDNYDFYDEKQKYCLRKNVFEPSSTNQIIYYRQCIVTYRRAFKFLQLLCQNDNVENKKYIRDQPGKMDPVNFITVTTNELRNLFNVMCKQIVQVPLFLLDFLMQVTQIPIKQNQQTLMNSSFFQDLCQMSNQFAKQGKLSERNFDDKQNPLEEIYKKSVKIILSNFQGNDSSTYKTLDSNLDPKFLVNILETKFKSHQIRNKQDLLNHIKNSLQSVDPETGTKTVHTMFNQELLSIFDILIIFMKLKQKLQSSRLYSSYLKFKQESPAQFEMLQHLQQSIIHIQINDSNDELQTIYFAKHPAFYSLSPNIRDYIMNVVKRDSHRQKIVSLIGYINSIKQSIQYSYRVKKSQNIIEENMNNSYYYASFMSCVVCLFMFGWYGVVIGYGQADFTANRIVKNICFLLSLIQLSMSLCYAYYWFMLQSWKMPSYKHKENEHEQKKQEQVQKFYKSTDFMRLLLFVTVSVYGTFFDPTVFFIHIIDIFCQSQSLANVFKAITKTIYRMFLVSFMGVIFVVIFCTVSFSNYTKDVYSQKQARNPQQLCDSMGTCMMDLYVSGSIGEMSQFQFQRFVYDTIYSVFFGMLFSNIISGIMLQSFGALREQQGKLDQDKSNLCYICQISRSKLEENDIDFKQHITKKHFLWNYVFYIISLNAKDKTDFTGLQYQIYRQIDNTQEDMKIKWIPFQTKKSNDDAQVLQKIANTIDEYNANVERSLIELDGDVKEFNSKAEELQGI